MSKKVLKTVNSIMTNKFAIIFLVVIISFIGIVSNITYINASKKNTYTKKIYSQTQNDSVVVPYKRGNIEDRNGIILATSKRVYNVILDCVILLSYEDKIESTKNALATYFEISNEEVQNAIDTSPNSRYVKLKENVEMIAADSFNEYTKQNPKDIKGVWLEEDYKRYYPYSKLACDTIGFTSRGNVGNLGLELFYNSTLNGVNGRKYGVYSTDEEIDNIIKEPVNGNSIVTTIDTNIQGIVERHIREFNAANKDKVKPGQGSKNTGVIVMNPNNGEVLAMASYPDFDLNDPYNITEYYSQETIDSFTDEQEVETLQNLWKNFCVSDLYEPGSTSKSITVAAGLEEGLLQGNEAYHCDGGKQVDDYFIKCHLKEGHQDLNLSRAIADSCNVALMDIGLNLGAKKLIKYLSAFNFGQATGIDLPGEAEGQLYNPTQMIDTDIATNSFGQNFTCSMIQMASAYCAIANGGKYYKPYIVKEVKNDRNEIIKETTPTMQNKVITKDTAAKLKSYMEEAVTSGTATATQVLGYTTAGKTGTAEKLPRGQENYVTSFAGFAPVSKPEVVVYVVLDEPNVENQATTAHVNMLTRNILSEIFSYMGITTQAEELSTLANQ